MESGDLRIFQAVAREGTITKAAQALNYVQSNVTSRIQFLEAEPEGPAVPPVQPGNEANACG